MKVEQGDSTHCLSLQTPKNPREVFPNNSQHGWADRRLKKPGVPARAAFDENLTHYKQQIPALFWFNALLIASNSTDSRVGSLTADCAEES
jgi:hypothetical protein